jgi:hypothetical protein
MEGWNTTWLGMSNTTCGSIKISRGNEFTKKKIMVEESFLDIRK